ncbi:hypothetical protein H0178_28665 [Cytobacillus firmus]|nr:hypothetical protein [Cytobacillus firmus]
MTADIRPWSGIRRTPSMRWIVNTGTLSEMQWRMNIHYTNDLKVDG